MKKLENVVDWFHLGLYLEVPEDELEIIGKNYPQDTKRCRTEMLSWWMNNTLEKKWATIVQALEKTGSKVLACNIALKYGTTLLHLLIPSSLIIIFLCPPFCRYPTPKCISNRSCTSASDFKSKFLECLVCTILIDMTFI